MSVPEVTPEQLVMALEPADGMLVSHQRAPDGGQHRAVLRGCVVCLEHRPHVADPDFPWGPWIAVQYSTVRPEVEALATELLQGAL